MQLFYDSEIAPPVHILGEEESRHCVRVLRLGAGDELHVTDGRGNLYRCRIVEPDQRRCRIEVVEHTPEFEKMPYRLTMAVAPTKNIDRFEWFLEKATEVGVSEIIPVESAHSERRAIKPEREEKVIMAAVKQSLKAYCPELRPMMRFRDVVTMPFEGRRFIAHCDEPAGGGKVFLPSAIRSCENILILIGPEGDFSPEEIKFAAANGFEEITLGPQRLRTETAAVVATVMVATLNNAG